MAETSVLITNRSKSVVGDELRLDIHENGHDNGQSHYRAKLGSVPNIDITVTLPDGARLMIGCERTCECPPNHINCLTAKDWMKSQIGVWQFTYEGRDIRNKELHPATFPLSLARKVIELFTHKGELVLDPFVGSGTTLQRGTRRGS